MNKTQTDKQKLEESLNSGTWVSKTKAYYDKTITSSKELKKAIQRKPRLAVWIIKYWSTVALTGIPLAVLLTWMGAKAYINFNFPSLEEMSGLILILAMVWTVIALCYRGFFRWVRKYDNEFDDLWLSELGMLITEKPKADDSTYEQHYEDIATEMCKRIIEDPRYKKLLDPKFKPEGAIFYPTKLRSKLFHIDIMRKEARKYYFTYWLPVELSRLATLEKIKLRKEGEVLWQNANQEKNSNENTTKGNELDEKQQDNQDVNRDL